jgi:hypothetical protein
MRKQHEPDIEIANAALLAAIDLTVGEARKAKSNGRPFNDQTFLRGAFSGIHYTLLMDRCNTQEENLQQFIAEEAQS